MRWIFTMYFLIFQNAWAQSLKGPIDRIAQEVNSIGFDVAFIGLGITGLYFVFGSPEATSKFSKAILGLFILSTGTLIVSFFKSIA